MGFVEILDELNSFGFFTVLVILSLAISGIIQAAKAFKEASGLFGKTHRQLMDEKFENEIEQLKKAVSKLEKSASKFNNDRIHDREKSYEIQKSFIENFGQLADTLAEIKGNILEDKIERKRWNILNFADELRRNDGKADSERFNNVFRDYDDYEKIIHEQHLTNGYAEESIKFIRAKYQEMLNNE